MTADAVRLTHVGGPTVLIEVAGRRLPTDPTFDPPGRRYAFGWGSSSRKLAGPAVDLPLAGRPLLTSIWKWPQLRPDPKRGRPPRAGPSL